MNGDHPDSAEPDSAERAAGAFERPRVHFTPTRGWLSDPNGLVHASGTYHLYYQHHPDSTSWGPMNWGHATSVDLVSWRHRPIALAPDEHGMIYSGSAVIDEEGTAGFGAQSLIAAFTYHLDGVEEQGLAWSRDGGDTFTKRRTPILEAPDGEKDFRDPRVLRYSADSEHWVMLLAVGRAVWIYTSTDLTTWTRTGTVTGVFCGDGTWEMPELMSFDVGGTTVWVLAVSIWGGAPAGGCGVQAVVGTFDGRMFTPSEDAFWVDHGPSFYAPQAWSSAPQDRRIWIGWMGNWHTVNELPAGEWRGQMSIPREVELRHVGSGYRLMQVPVPELNRHRGQSFVASGVDVGQCLGQPLRLTAATLDVAVLIRGGGVVSVTCESGGRYVDVRVDLDDHRIATTVGGSGAAESIYRADMPPAGHATELGGLTRLRILLDVASIEVFAGTATLSVLLVNGAEPWTVTINADGIAQVERVESHSLDPG